MNTSSHNSHRKAPSPVIIDTDMGVDDALALILALRSPELTVEAVTTVAGNAAVRQCTANVLAMLELLRADRGIAVAQGAARPLMRKLTTAAEVHGADGLGNARPSTRKTRKADRKPAARLIADLCDRHRRKLTIVALGPLTNIASVLKERPHSLKKIGRLVSMGGAFRVPGNTGPVAEFNYFVDPEAAQIVLNSGIPVTVVPLDLTEQLVLMRKEAVYRAERRSNALSRFILKMTRLYMNYHKQTEGFFGGYLHDPVAVGAAIDPTLMKTRRVHVDVETSGVLTRGMTVADFRKRPSRRPFIDVAFRIDKDRFLKLFHERLWS